jgi:hypothetical protein
MSRAGFRAALELARLDAVLGTILSSRRRTMTNHGDAAMLSKLGGAQPINQHAYPIYDWFRLRGRAVTEEGTIDDQAVVMQQTYKNEERALWPRSFTDTTHIQTSIPVVINLIEDGVVRSPAPRRRRTSRTTSSTCRRI